MCSRDGPASHGICYRPGDPGTSRWGAFRKFERPDSRQPREVAEILAFERIVFTRHPERAVVNRIDGQAAVIAPAEAECFLNAGSLDQFFFCAEDTGRIGCQFPGEI